MNTGELIEWFDTVRRDLPWRRRRDPWAVLVSEVMLQQTQVDRVVAYWLRFMERFPDVGTCAAADSDDVVALWTGLGYYRRARALHRCAQQLVDAGAPGRWPESVHEWRALPGIGAYTAAALASSCSGVVVAAVDGNVERVVGRWLGLAGRYRAAQRREVGKRVEEILDPTRPGDSNQALIELGALICRPTVPACARCPAEASCLAARSGEAARYGPTRTTRAPEDVSLTMLWIERSGRVLVVRRPATAGLLDGLWELPWFESTNSDSLVGRYGIAFRLGRSLGWCDHAITYRRISAQVVEAGCPETPRNSQWVAIDDLAELATSSLVLKARLVALRASVGGELVIGSGTTVRR